MKHVAQTSGGLSSEEMLARVCAEHGTESVTAVFCDTIVEDSDLYRFLLESTAFCFRMPLSSVADLAERASKLPAINETTLDLRKQLLASLRADAMKRIPQLVWLADGRTPWEVIFDTRFLSHRSDKCSEFLKRRLSDAWCKANCDSANTTRYVGYGWNEQKRIEKSRKRFEADGWRVEFPMDNSPLLVQVTLMQAWLDRGIQPPRAYYQGSKHNNCGRFCFHAGQASAARLLATDPCYYGYNERQEARFRETIFADASTLKDRRGGGRRSISLQQFREQIQAGGLIDHQDQGSCSCFAEDDSEDEEIPREAVPA